ncbi:putative mediator of RNA polymerase II transcription subunit 33A/B [Dioscorea sansibarensis]
MAYILVLSGAFVWGVGRHLPGLYSFSSRCAGTVSNHMDFVTRVVDGNVTLRCDLAMFKAHVSSLVSLWVGFVPAWVPEMKQDTLSKKTG